MPVPRQYEDEEDAPLYSMGMLMSDYEQRTRRIYLTGLINEGMNDVPILIDKLAEASDKPITLVINSPGGLVNTGLAIANAMWRAQASGVKFYAAVRGSAMSMVFTILQLCDCRAMGRYDLLMAHGITSGVVGDSRTFEAHNKMVSHLRAFVIDMMLRRITPVKPEAVTASREYWQH